MAMVPASRPKLTRSAVEFMLAQHKVRDSVALVGARGYYRDSMGKPGVNDRGIYDDAIFLISPEGFVSFNANVDPSAFRRGIAVLKAGVWRYKIGVHGLSKPAAQRYKALVQAGPVTVHRDETGDDTGWFGINIHRGGTTTTSSLGCQTIVPGQWAGFMAMVEQELRRQRQGEIRYVLVQDGAWQ